MVDIPGCYSLMAHSAEEEVARDFICFENPDAVVVVCDATCLERNLNLVLQILEAESRVVVCVNLMDEAKKKQIHIDLGKLSRRLGVPVIGTSARSNKGLDQIYNNLKLVLMEEEMEEAETVKRSKNAENKDHTSPQKTSKTSDQRQKLNSESSTCSMDYPVYVEDAIKRLESAVKQAAPGYPKVKWLCARLLDANEEFMGSVKKYLGSELAENHEILTELESIKAELEITGIGQKRLSDDIAAAYVRKAEKVCQGAITFENKTYNRRDRLLDRLFTSKATGFPIMFLMLLGIFWLTITGANYPSQLLSKGLFWVEAQLFQFLMSTGLPVWFNEMLVFGVYRVLAWVVSVMLPPMAIFFPLFTLLEDFGYLPRVAFNLDRCFKRCCACGKQALTMCMGFGCNAAGIVGCRIIDSPRERLIAMITNNFVPCNGRYPTMITIISMFFIGSAAGLFATAVSSAILAAIIVIGIVMTLVISWILSKTILKGIPSSFTLELPPYRRPQIGKVIVRSIVDRTLFVLGRAAAIAAPAGLIIWIMANVTVGDTTLLTACSGYLDPFGRMLGLDGVILMAFILGFPANEIVVPIMIMAYMAEGKLVEMNDLNVLRQLLVQNGWTWITAISMILFSLMHWPCSTTCLTIKKETQSMKWTLVSFLVPTVTGVVICFLFSHIAAFFI